MNDEIKYKVESIFNEFVANEIHPLMEGNSKIGSVFITAEIKDNNGNEINISADSGKFSIYVSRLTY